MVNSLEKQGIEAKRTTNNSPKGDILIVDKEDAARVRKILRNLNEKING